ncbi:hypothetical protein ARMSODRAFT_1085565 [Armillaria solidipes]|uniref:Uncharacterized protein n=1 Tax=Armillaria solidipes TaxID=1076256 RepID=A0A2H3BF31_9AGAR|nr:hypothetical protein ARMSODRAFT_1085565 [Armillaria solidipes]
MSPFPSLLRQFRSSPLWPSLPHHYQASESFLKRLYTTSFAPTRRIDFRRAASARRTTGRRKGLGDTRQQHDGHTRRSHGSKVCTLPDPVTERTSTYPQHPSAMTSTYFCADATYRVPARWTGSDGPSLLFGGFLFIRSTSVTPCPAKESSFAARQRIVFRRARVESMVGPVFGLFREPFGFAEGSSLFGLRMTLTGRTTIRRSPPAREGMCALGLQRILFPAPSPPSVLVFVRGRRWGWCDMAARAERLVIKVRSQAVDAFVHPRRTRRG